MSVKGPWQVIRHTDDFLIQEGLACFGNTKPAQVLEQHGSKLACQCVSQQMQYHDIKTSEKLICPF